VLTPVAVEDLTDGLYLFVGLMRSRAIWAPNPVDVGTVVVKNMESGDPLVIGFGDFRKLSACPGQWFRITCSPELLAAEQRRIDLAFLEHRLLNHAWWVKNPPTWEGFKVTDAMLHDILRNVVRDQDDPVANRLIALYREVYP
jgi:hypothetical protein